MDCPVSPHSGTHVPHCPLHSPRPPPCPPTPPRSDQERTGADGWLNPLTICLWVRRDGHIYQRNSKRELAVFFLEQFSSGESESRTSHLQFWPIFCRVQGWQAQPQVRFKFGSTFCKQMSQSLWWHSCVLYEGFTCCKVQCWSLVQIWRSLIGRSQRKTEAWRGGWPMSVLWAKKRGWLPLRLICERKYKSK